MSMIFAAPLLRSPRHWLVALLAALALCLAALSTPALAHKDHKKKQEMAEQLRAQQQRAAAAPAVGTEAPAPMSGTSPAAPTMHSSMGEMMDEVDDERSAMSPFERFIDWLGRLHPIIVHFPIAFFPAALFTAVVGRRRTNFAKPVQFLVVAGGIIAPLAALLGWFGGGMTLTDTDPLLRVHRWLGTAIGIGGLGLAIWAWRNPEEDRGTGMILGLAIITSAIIVQGWFGGALVHGMDHMNW